MLDCTDPILTPTISHQRSRGTGRLSVKKLGENSKIDNLFQNGCAKLRLPRTAGEGLQAVMINSSGGMTGGDRLEWQFDLAAQTALTVTSQACERIYAASSDVAHTDVGLSVQQGARLAWLPQETILFNNGAFKRTVDVDLAAGAELLMVEPVIFGRQAMDETVQSGLFRDSWRVRQDGHLVHAEEALFNGPIGDQLACAAVGGGSVAMATVLLIAPRAEGLMIQAREILGASGGCSLWSGKFLARVVSKDGYSLRKKLIPLINLLNDGTPLPKIWTL